MSSLVCTLFFVLVFQSLAILETESALTDNRARQNAVLKLPVSPYTRVFSAHEEKQQHVGK